MRYFILYFLLVGICSAFTYDINFDIIDESSVLETLTMTFPNGTVQKEYFFKLRDFSELRVESDGKEIAYHVHAEDDEKLINFTIPGGTNQIAISYIARDLIFSKDEEYVLSTIFTPPPDADNIRIKVALPEGYLQSREDIHPENWTRYTDGKRIIFEWSFSGRTSPISIQVYYYTPFSISGFPLIGIFLLICGATGLIIYYRRRSRKERWLGFSIDEKKIIDFISSRRTLFQDDINENFNFSRAKVTRIIKRLEEQGLIEKQKIGKTNRIIWKK
jgi:uncharacterized membrane protein